MVTGGGAIKDWGVLKIDRLTALSTTEVPKLAIIFKSNFSYESFCISLYT